MILYYKITISTIVFNNSTIFKTDSNNNNIIPFWKELNSEIVKVKESLATDIFKDFNNGVSIDVLQQKYTNLDNSLVQYLNDTEKGKAVYADYSKSVEKTGKSLEIASLKAKLFNAAINVGIALAVSAAIKLIDQLHTSTEEYITSQEEAIERSNTNIAKYDEEILSIQDLQIQLKEAKNNKKDLITVTNNLNKVIGETPGLINNEADAYELANKKLEARIEYYKKLREQEIDNIVNANKNIFENNGVTNDSTGSIFDFFNADLSRIKNGSFNSFLYSDYTKGIKDIERVLNKDFNALVREYLNNNPNLSVNEAAYNVFKENFGFKDVSFIPSQSEFDKLLSSQTKTLEDYYSDYISSYDGSIDKSLINAFMEDMVIGGYDLQDINNKLKTILNDTDFEKLYEDYQLSFSDESLNTEELYDSLKIYFDNLKKELPTASDEIDTFFDSIISGIKDVYDTTNGIITQSLSDKFKDLWNSDSFADAKEDLSKLAKESKITASDINDLAKENIELADLLEESGMSAQFAAECFDSMCRGGKGFDAITNDALLLDQVLNGMTGSLEQATQAKSEYDNAMSKEDYNANFKNYQEAYSSAMEMFKNGEYGKHFRDTMEYLLGTDSYTMSIDELRTAVQNLGSVFGESATNGYEFLDKLWSKKEVLDDLNSSLTKLPDGSYDFDLKPDEFDAIADALGMTTEEVAACTNALGMFGDYSSYDLDELELALNSISIAAHDGEKSITSLQGVENILSDLGYSGYDVYQIMQQIQGMGTIELIDFEEGNLDDTLSKLKELENVKIDGSNIDLDSLISGMQALGNSGADITNFIDRLNGQFNLTDAQGKLIDFETAKNQALSATKNGVSEDLTKVGENADTSTKSVSNLNTEVDTLNKKTLSQVQLQFVNVSTVANTAKENVQKIIDKINTLNNSKISIKSSTTTEKSDGKGYHGTVGNAFANGTNEYDDIPNLPITGYNGLPKDEKNALRSEYGQQELTVYPNGKTELTNQPTMSDLPKGTVIFNERQTKKILNGTNLTSGNAFASGTVKKDTSTSSQTGKSNGKSTGKNNNNDKDNSKSKTEIDWIARKLERLQKIIDATKAKFENLFTVKSKSSNLDKQIKQTTSLLKANEKAAKKYKSYADKYAKKSGLSKSLIKKIQNGDYSITDYDDKTAEKINKYKEYWDLYKDAKQNVDELTTSVRELKEEKLQLYVDDAEAKIAKSQAYAELDAGNYKEQNKHIEYQKKQIKEQYKYQIKIAKLNKDNVEVAKLRAELQKELNDLTKQEFDNISNTYDKQIGLNNNKIQAFQDQISLLEAQGQKVGSALYAKQISLNNANEKKLVTEREKLISKLKDIPKNTDDWYDAVDTLFAVDSELTKIQIDNANLQKSINQLKFDRFDDLLAKLNDIVDETDFIIDMLDSEKFFDDNGKITDDGITAMGMYAQKRDVYLSEAQKYKDQMAELDKMYANGDIGIIDYETKMHEYKNGQMDMAKAAEDMNKSIINLVRDGLEKQNKALSESIQKQKDLLRAEKDLKSFQDSLNDANKNISRLERQYEILSGDDSEENRKRLREIKSQLEDAKKSRDDLLYDKSIEDQEKNLDDMYDAAVKNSEEYLKDSTKVLIDAFGLVNANTETVSKNIERISKETGVNISDNITNAWKQSGNAVSGFGTTVFSTMPGVLSQISLVTEQMKQLAEESEKASKALKNKTTDSYLDYTTLGKDADSNDKAIKSAENKDKKYHSSLSTGGDDFALAKNDGLLKLVENVPQASELLKNMPFQQWNFPNIDAYKNLPIIDRTPPVVNNFDNRVTVEGVATDKIVKDFENVATKQAEKVVSKINNMAYAKGVRLK